MEAIKASGIEFSVLFYNPNIHPLAEYELRKQENIRYCHKLHIPFIDADYLPDTWFQRVKGHEQAPERGTRCTICFDMRFEYAAHYAAKHGFRAFTSSLSISRWKDFEQINRAGVRAASNYADLEFWTYNWRKAGGSSRMLEISKNESFYKQEYCGCVYSLRDTNKHRQKANRPRIQRGVEFYSFADGEEGAKNHKIIASAQSQSTNECTTA